MEPYTTLATLAFALTAGVISQAQLMSTLYFLIERLLSIVDLRVVFFELLDMTFGLEELSHILTFVKPLVGHDFFHFDVPATPTQFDLCVGIAFLVSFGSMCYLSRDNDIRITKTTKRILDDFFGSPALPARQPNYVFYGLAPVSMADFLRRESPTKSTNPLDGIFEYPVISTPIRKCAPVVSHPPSSWSVPAYSTFSSLSACFLGYTSNLSSAISSCVTAAKSRYLSIISPLTSKTTTLPSLPTCYSLSDVSALDLDLTLLDDAEDPFGTDEPRRVFGVVFPADPWQPKVITLVDLEIDDGSYLRDALGMSHSESLECTFWPELDEFVPPRSDERPGAWYTDADEMRGWLFPGREDVPEFTFEPIPESDWHVEDAIEVASKMAQASQ